MHDPPSKIAMTVTGAEKVRGIVWLVLCIALDLSLGADAAREMKRLEAGQVPSESGTKS